MLLDVANIALPYALLQRSHLLKGLLERWNIALNGFFGHMRPFDIALGYLNTIDCDKFRPRWDYQPARQHDLLIADDLSSDGSWFGSATDGSEDVLEQVLTFDAELEEHSEDLKETQDN